MFEAVEIGNQVLAGAAAIVLIHRSEPAVGFICGPAPLAGRMAHVDNLKEHICHHATLLFGRCTILGLRPGSAAR